MDNTRIAEISDRARRLKDLANTPGWLELKQAFEVRRDKWATHIAKELLMQNSTINQRELDWKSGFLAGCQWLIANPDLAEDTLEKALRAAERMNQT